MTFARYMRRYSEIFLVGFSPEDPLASAAYAYIHTPDSYNYSNPRCAHARRGLIILLTYYLVSSVSYIFGGIHAESQIHDMYTW